MTTTAELPGLWDHAPWRPLPALWDGRPVEWTPVTVGHVFMCRATHHREDMEHCERCGRASERRQWRGTVWAKPGDHVQADGEIRTGRHYWRDRVVQPGDKVTFEGLYAWRCTECGIDTVIELSSGALWLLDEDDYGPEGSTP